MRVISFDDIQNLNLDKALFYDWVKETFEAKDTTILPPKTSMHYYNGKGFVNVMPSIIPAFGVYGVKVVSRNPDSIPTLKSNLMLFDLHNNDLLAVMDADFITAFRTGATAALAIETLARPGYTMIGLLGLGNICRAFLLVLLSRLKDRKITLKLYLYKNTDYGLSELLSQFENVRIETYETIRETIEGSDVVVSCVTYAENDLAEPEWFKKGCLLVPVHTRGFLNCDLAFDRVIVDDRAHVQGFKNYNEFKNLSELSEVLKNPLLGRQNNDERIIAYNIGISILDIVFAKKIYDLSVNEHEADISGVKQKFWVR